MFVFWKSDSQIVYVLYDVIFVVPFSVVVFSSTQPLSSITSNVYVPAVNPVIFNPVWPPTLELQLSVNGGSPTVISTSSSPSSPFDGCVFTKENATPLDGSIVKFCVCWHPSKSVTVTV